MAHSDLMLDYTKDVTVRIESIGHIVLHGYLSWVIPAADVQATFPLPDSVAPTLTAVSITSDNTDDSTLAIPGNVVRLSFTSDEPILFSSVDVTINGDRAGISGDGMSWTAERTIRPADNAGTVTFTIDYSDYSSNAGDTVTGVDTGNTNVSINQVTLPSDQEIELIRSDLAVAASATSAASAVGTIEITQDNTSDFDLDSQNTNPRGITAANDKIYVADLSDDVYVYDPADDGSRVTSLDFELASKNGSPSGMTELDGKFYVVDDVRDKIYVYNSDGTRDNASSDINLNHANEHPTGIAAHEGDLWVVDNDDSKVYVYNTGRSYVETLNFDLDAENSSPQGITSLYGKLWVTDSTDDQVYAYNTDGTRDDTSDFDLGSANSNPRGITASDGMFYVSDDIDHKVYAYSAVIVVRDETSDFGLDTNNDSSSGITSINGKLWVVDWTDSKIYAYNSAGGTRDAASDITLDTNNANSNGITALDGKFYVVDSTDNKVYVYNTDGTTRDATLDFNLDAANNNIQPTGITAYNGKLWVTDTSFGDGKIYVYDTDGTIDSDSNFVLDADNLDPNGITSINGKLWVTDNVDDKVYVYNPDGTRDSSLDFDLDADNLIPNGITSINGKLWVVDVNDDKVYVYNYAKGIEFGIDGLYANTSYKYTTTKCDVTAPGTNAADFDSCSDSVTSEKDSDSTGTLAINVDGPFEDQQQYVYSEVNKKGGGGPAAKLSHTDFIVQTQNGAISYFEPTVVVAAVDDTPPTLSIVSITSDNTADTTTAIHGNIITLSFTASEDISTPVVTINGVTAADTVTADAPGNNASWSATRTITSADTDGAVTFTIDFSDLATNAGIQVDTTTDNTTVTISTIALPANQKIELLQDDLDVISNVGVTRDAASDFDLVAANTTPQGITALDDKLLVVDATATNDKVFAYNAADGSRVSAFDFSLSSSNVLPHGITVHDGKFWIVDNISDHVYVYDSDGTFDFDFSLSSANINPRGITALDGKIWVADSTTYIVYAYNTDGTPDAASDIALDVANAAGNFNPGGVTAFDGKLWVVDSIANKVFVYNTDGTTRDSTLDFDLDSDNTQPNGITYLDGKLWVVDSEDNQVYAYDIAERIQFDIKGLYANTSYEYTTTKCDVTAPDTNTADFDSCSDSITSQTSSDSTGALSINVDGPFTNQQFVFVEVKVPNQATAIYHTDFIVQTQDGAISYFEPAVSYEPVRVSVSPFGNIDAKSGDTIQLDAVIQAGDSNSTIEWKQFNSDQSAFVDTLTLVPSLDTRSVTFDIPYYTDTGLETITISATPFDSFGNIGNPSTKLVHITYLNTDNTLGEPDITAPTLDSVTIASDNSNDPSWATAGDTIILSFRASEGIATPPDVTINGVAADTVTADTVPAGVNATTIWSATKYVVSADTDGPVTFSIDFADLAIPPNAGDTVNTTTIGRASVTIDKMVPTLTAVSIISDNADDMTVAIPGDIVTLSFTSSEGIQQPAVSIGGDAVTATAITDANNSNTIWSATKTITSADLAGPVTFTINYSDLATNAGTIITSTIGSGSGSAVTIPGPDITKPTLPLVSIASDNSDTSRATDGDTITLHFIASEGIATPVVTINGVAADTVTGSGNTSWSATKTVASTDSAGLVTFTIDFADLAVTLPNAGDTATGTTDGTVITVYQTGTPPDTTDPTLTAVTISSDNSNDSTRATTGDTITVHFTSDEPILVPVVSIGVGAAAGTAADTVTADANSDNTIWSATKTVVPADPDGPVTFTIDYTDLAANDGTQVIATIGDNTAVTIDTTAPTLNTVTMESDYSFDPSMARVGDTITVHLTSDEDILQPVVSINGDDTAVTVTGSGDTWSAAKIVTAADTAAAAVGPVSFAISYSDLATNAGDTVTALTAGSAIIISGPDTTNPTLSLVSIESNNANDSSLARVGNTISVNFTSDEPILVPVVTINGAASSTPPVADADSGNTVWSATKRIGGADTHGSVVAFTIDYTDLSENAGVTFDDTTDGTTVTIDKVKPTLDMVSITSDNTTSDSLAKPGDTITLHFTSSEPIRTPTVKFNEIIAAASAVTADANSGNTVWSATKTIVSADTDGLVSFDIAYSDLATNNGDRITGTTDSTGVTIDATIPTLDPVTITSDNANDTTTAVLGDTITLSFTSSEPIDVLVVTINGDIATVTDDSTTTVWSATKDVGPTDPNGIVSFNIDYNDLALNGDSLISNPPLSLGTTDDSIVTISGQVPPPDTTKPRLGTVTIASDNTDTSRATTGDIITLRFTASEGITTPTVTINSNAATVAPAEAGSNTSWSATKTVASGDTQGVVAFTIDFSDLASTPNVGAQVVDTTDDAAVTIDTIAPTLGGTVSIISDNTDTSRATTDDTITLSFIASEGIQEPTVTINNNAATVAPAVAGSNTSWSATKIVASGDTEGPVTFTINYADLAANDGTTQVIATGDNTAVTIDRTAPTLSMVSMISSNSDTSTATAGDTITLSFTSSEPILQPTVNIRGGAADTVTASGNTWSATKMITSADIDGAVSFGISFADLASNAGTPVIALSAGNTGVVIEQTGPVTPLPDSIAPELDTVIIESSNSNMSRATIDDTITLRFIASEGITTPVVTINTDAITAVVAEVGSNTSWSATKTVASGDTQGVVAFTIDFSDLASTPNVGIQVVDTTDDTTVTIDTISPILDTVTIKSDNSDDTSQAIPGDTITLSFISSEPIQEPVVNINGDTIAATVFPGSDDSFWFVKRTITPEDRLGTVTFDISFTDLASNGGSMVTVTTDDTSVTIDQMMTVPTLPPTNQELVQGDLGVTNTGGIKFRIVGLAANTYYEYSTSKCDVTVEAGTSVPDLDNCSDFTSRGYSDGDGQYRIKVDGPFTNQQYVSASAKIPNSDDIIYYTDFIVQVRDGDTISYFESDVSDVTLEPPTTNPTLSAVSIASDNSNDSSRATTDDIITLSFTSSVGIETPDVTINAGTAVAVAGNDNTDWSATKTITAADTDGPVLFEISFTDLTNNVGTPVIVTTDESAVTVDQMAPTLDTVSIASNKLPDSFLVTTDDIVILRFTSSEDILPPTVTINGDEIIATLVGNDNTIWRAEKTITAADIDGTVVTFAIDYTDLATNAGTKFTGTTDGSSVTIDQMAPTLTTVTIASDNSDTSLATTGDVVTLSFTSSEPIETPDVTISGDGASAIVTGSGDTWSATKTIVPEDSDGTVVTFTINYADLALNPGSTVTGTTTDNSSVTIDQTGSSSSIPTSEIQEENLGVTNTGGIKFSIGGLDASTYYQYTTSKCDVADPDDETCSDFAFAKRTNSNGELVIIMAGPFTNLQYVYAEVKEIGKADPIYRTSFTVQVQGNDITNFESVVSSVIPTEPVIPEPPTPEPPTPEPPTLDTTAPTLTAVSIVSNNANDTTLATDGDTVTLSFTSDEPILEPTVTISGVDASATVTGSGDTWSATKIITSTDTNGSTVMFTIDYTDLSSNDGARVTGTTGGTSVTIDQTVTPTPPSTSQEIQEENLGVTNTGGIKFSIGGLDASTYYQYTTSKCDVADPDDETCSDFTFAKRSDSNGILVIIMAGPFTNLQYVYAEVKEIGKADPIYRTDFTVQVQGNTISHFEPVVSSVIPTEPVIPEPPTPEPPTPEPPTPEPPTPDTTAPTLTTVSIESNNTNDTTLATDGNTITLSFTSDEPILPPTVTINGDTVTATVLGGDTTTWSAETTIASTDADGVVDFSISFFDLASNDGGIATSLTTGNPGVTVDNTAPTLTTVSIESDNTDTNLATTDDTITLEFTSSEPIQTPAVTFGGISADTVTESGNTWSATKIITAADSDGSAVTFDISFSDLATNVGIPIAATTDGTDVTVSQTSTTADTTKPTLRTVLLTSDNSVDNTLAIPGDTVTLSFTSDEPILPPTVTINGDTVTATVFPETDNTFWVATTVITPEDSPGAVTFEIAFTDLADNVGTPVTGVTGSGTGVTISQTVQYDLAVKGDGIRVKINGVFAERTYHEWSTSHCDVSDGNDCVDDNARGYSKDSGRVVIDIVDDDNNFADQRHVSISVKIPNTEDALYSTDFIVQVVNGEIVHEPDMSGVIPQSGNSGGNSNNNNNNNNSDDGDSKTGSPSTITTKPTPSDRLLKNFIAAESDSDVIKQTDTAAIITAIITATEPTTATATEPTTATATATATEPTTTATATEPTTTPDTATPTKSITTTTTPDTTADTDTTTPTTLEPAAPPSDTTLKNSNDDDDDFKTRPTFGISGQTFTQIVDCGYSMDGVCTDVTEYHVDYNRKIIQTGTAHDFALKAYAQNGMKSFVIGFGVNEVGAPASESEASITVNLGRDYTLDSTYTIDSVEYDNDENVIGENATFAVSGVSCGGGSGGNNNNDNNNGIIQKNQIQCTQLLIDGVLFREAMYDEPFMIEAVDAKRKVITHYMNEGLQVTGESINEPPTHKFSSKKTSQSDAVILELVRTDKLGNIWTDQFGYTWSADTPDEWYYVVGPVPDNSSACDSVDHRACDAFAAKVRWHNGNMESLRDSMYGDVYGATAAKPFDDLDDAVTFLITPGESRTQFLDENAMMWIRN